MAGFNFSRIAYSEVLLRQLRAALVLGQISQFNECLATNGFVRGGSVQILVPGDVAIGPYSGSLTFTEIDTDPNTLVLDQFPFFAKSFGVVNASVISAQQEQRLVENILGQGAYQLAYDVDVKHAALYAGAGRSFNWSDPIDETNIKKFIGSVRDQMDVAHIAQKDRWLALPSVLGSTLSNALAGTFHADLLSKGLKNDAGLVFDYMGIHVLFSPNIVAASGALGPPSVKGASYVAGSATNTGHLTITFTAVGKAPVEVVVGLNAGDSLTTTVGAINTAIAAADLYGGTANGAGYLRASQASGALVIAGVRSNDISPYASIAVVNDVIATMTVGFETEANATGTFPTSYYPMAGGCNALGFACSVDDMWYGDLKPLAFGTGLAGIIIYGVKVVQPTALISSEIAIA